MSLPTNIAEYTQLLNLIKQRVQLAQKRAIFSASAEMLRMYWDIGEMLQFYNDRAKWGDKVLERLYVDLKNEYPSIKGFTTRNCRYMMQFYREYNKDLTFVKPSVSQFYQKYQLPIIQIGWAHNVVIMQRVKDIDARYWYMVQTIQNS